jgi:hypothetical protein
VRKRREGGLSLGEVVAEHAELARILDDAGTAQMPQYSHAHDLQEVRNLGGLELRQRMEDLSASSVVALEEHAGRPLVLRSSIRNGSRSQIANKLAADWVASFIRARIQASRQV